MKLFLIFYLVFFISVFKANSKKLIIADISDNKINIDVGFKGAKLLFFGVIDEKGDVVVSVTGPRKTVEVRKKEKKMGLWLNSDTKVFFDVPSYYYVASTRPLKELNADNVLQINQVGIENIRFAGAEEQEERSSWVNGIIKSMIEAGRYNPEQGLIQISDKRLFKTELNFSAELVEGQYLVDTLLLRKGAVIAARMEAQEIAAEHYNERHGKPIDVVTGDLVFCEDHRYNATNLPTKMLPKCTGGKSLP